MDRKIKLCNYILISTISSVCNGEVQEFIMSEEDYDKLEYISSITKYTEEQTIIIGLEKGTIVLDPAGEFRFNKSVYEILLEQNLIDVKDTSISTVCAKSHSN